MTASQTKNTPPCHFSDASVCTCGVACGAETEETSSLGLDTAPVWETGIEPGKTRPVLVVQTNLLNKIPHPSTIICPITTNVKKEAEILRIHISKGLANVQKDSDIMLDQIRAIDNKRLIKKVGDLPKNLISLVKENLMIIIDLEQYTTVQHN